MVSLSPSLLSPHHICRFRSPSQHAQTSFFACFQKPIGSKNPSHDIAPISDTTRRSSYTPSAAHRTSTSTTNSLDERSISTEKTCVDGRSSRPSTATSTSTQKVSLHIPYYHLSSAMPSLICLGTRLTRASSSHRRVARWTVNRSRLNRAVIVTVWAVRAGHCRSPPSPSLRPQSRVRQTTASTRLLHEEMSRTMRYPPTMGPALKS